VARVSFCSKADLQSGCCRNEKSLLLVCSPSRAYSSLAYFRGSEIPCDGGASLPSSIRPFTILTEEPKNYPHPRVEGDSRADTGINLLLKPRLLEALESRPADRVCLGRLCAVCYSVCYSVCISVFSGFPAQILCLFDNSSLITPLRRTDLERVSVEERGSCRGRDARLSKAKQRRATSTLTASSFGLIVN
jgi:hypothetical protein